ncbi:hypothetical protein [Ktedonospora formicarum]|uniref:Uncharacterized protein n=1 Tax=Ktedonospora formicarum TaxID=2778364 RepID=A0A8J3HY82_9CHLR|nr:hypothetical protein [Ktedonospora formicarum]GHO42154.1 hypothetical protein KSX_03170 [Ktedonospora formicarum]
MDKDQNQLKQWRRELAGQPAQHLAPLRQAIMYLQKQRAWIGSYEQWNALAAQQCGGGIAR